MSINLKISSAVLALLLTSAFPAPLAAEPLINNAASSDVATGANTTPDSDDVNPPMPQPKQAGDVTYLSGGIGNDERDAIEAQAADYNLRISSSNKEGQFMIGNNFVIASKNGHEIVAARNAGPLFYAKLPAGEYKITAGNGTQQETRSIRIGTKKPENVYFVWQNG